MPTPNPNSPVTHAELAVVLADLADARADLAAELAAKVTTEREDVFHALVTLARGIEDVHGSERRIKALEEHYGLKAREEDA